MINPTNSKFCRDLSPYEEIDFTVISPTQRVNETGLALITAHDSSKKRTHEGGEGTGKKKIKHDEFILEWESLPELPYLPEQLSPSTTAPVCSLSETSVDDTPINTLVDSVVFGYSINSSSSSSSSSSDAEVHSEKVALQTEEPQISTAKVPDHLKGEIPSNPILDTLLYRVNNELLDCNEHVKKINALNAEIETLRHEHNKMRYEYNETISEMRQQHRNLETQLAILKSIGEPYFSKLSKKVGRRLV